MVDSETGYKDGHPSGGSLICASTGRSGNLDRKNGGNSLKEPFDTMEFTIFHCREHFACARSIFSRVMTINVIQLPRQCAV
jgi:hypothetical protein